MVGVFLVSFCGWLGGCVLVWLVVGCVDCLVVVCLMGGSGCCVVWCVVVVCGMLG